METKEKLSEEEKEETAVKPAAEVEEKSETEEKSEVAEAKSEAEEKAEAEEKKSEAEKKAEAEAEKSAKHGNPFLVRKRLPVWAVVLIVAGILAAVLAAAAIAYFRLYADIYPRIISEYGDALPEASAFARGDAAVEYLSPTDGIDVSKEGSYVLELLVNGQPRRAILAVRDTVAPTAKAAQRSITIDETLSPEELVSDISDKSAVTVSYSKKPDFGTGGDYEAVIKLTDEGGNSALVTVPVHIRALVDELEWESGAESPTAEEFLLVEREDAVFASGTQAVNTAIPGKYDVAITVDGVDYKSVLNVVDNTAPVLKLRSVIIKPGEAYDEMDCVESVEDESDTELTFKGEVDANTPGEYHVKVEARDLGGNVTEGATRVVVSDYAMEVEARRDQIYMYELAEANDLNAGMVGIPEAFYPVHIGAWGVRVWVNGYETVAAVNVVDTVAPTATPVTATGCVGYPCDPMSFVTDIHDVTRVTAYYLTEPDWQRLGKQDVSVMIVDEGGNETQIDSAVEMSRDSEPPKLYGARDRFCYVDEAVAYFKEVFAEDNADPDVELTVDKSAVNIHKAGEYPVTYTARDHDGNTATASVTYTFVEQKVTDEVLDELAQKVLDEILTDDMTLTEQALAVFDYVYYHVAYLNGSDKTDWKSEAYRGLTQNTGDCFTSYSTEYLLLSKLDCEIMSVERLGGATHHYWCLVNLGYGWYHFDACAAGPDHYRAFMSTNYELWEMGSVYWNFDHSLYPEIETELYYLNPDNPDR